MSTPQSTRSAAVILDDRDPQQAAEILRLRSAGADVRDDPTLPDQLARLIPPPTERELAEPLQWAYFPWRHTLVRIPGRHAFDRIRLDRNRHKITAAEQVLLRDQRVGVAGLSSGFSIAFTLALDGLCGYLRLTDFDELELSNLNRVPLGLLDLGLNKAVAAARRIAELDPYLRVDVLPGGLHDDNVDEFVSGLDVVVEQCDSFDMKVAIREAARRHRVPVVMQTNDLGTLDVERFDDRPDRPLFHGLLPEIDPARLRALTPEQKTPLLLGILGGGRYVSARGGASLLELGRTIGHWPQLGSESQFGAATAAAVIRRLGLTQNLPSGRIRIDLDGLVQDLAEPVVAAGHHPGPTAAATEHPAGPTTATAEPAASTSEGAGADPVRAVLEAATVAPSGGNSQPWRFRSDPSGITIEAAAPTTSIDIGGRGTLVAIGAAAFNGRVAAAFHSILGPCRVFPPQRPAAVAEICFTPGGAEPGLAALYPAVLDRMSNRNPGRRDVLDPALVRELHAAARAEGAQLRLFTEPEQLAPLARVLGEADRLRYLTPQLHGDMVRELHWPGHGDPDAGIDVRSLGLGPASALLDLVVRPDVMAALVDARGGSLLADLTAGRVMTASALAVICADGRSPADYVTGGSATERVWVTASASGLGVFPISPAFLYACGDDDLAFLPTAAASRLDELRRSLRSVLGLLDDQAPVLILRLCHDPGPAIRSRRRPLSEVMISSHNTHGVTRRQD